MLNLFYLQLSLFIIYLTLLFPEILRFEKNQARTFRRVILLFFLVNSTAGFIYIFNFLPLAPEKIILTRDILPSTLGYLLGVTLAFFEFWPVKLIRLRSIPFLIFLIPAIYLFFNGQQLNFPISDYSFNPQSTIPGEEFQFEVVEFEILYNIPYLAEEVYYAVNTKFILNDQVVERKNWPVLLKAMRNTETFLYTTHLEEEKAGFLPGFYNSVLVIDNYDFLELRAERPEAVSFSRELQRNLNTFMGW